MLVQDIGHGIPLSTALHITRTVVQDLTYVHRGQLHFLAAQAGDKQLECEACQIWNKHDLQDADC